MLFFTCLSRQRPHMCCDFLFFASNYCCASHPSGSRPTSYALPSIGPFRLQRSRKSSVPCRVQLVAGLMVVNQSLSDSRYGQQRWWQLYLGWVGRISNQVWWFCQPLVRFTAPANRLFEQLLRYERNLVFHDVKCCSGKFVGQSAMRHHEIAFLHFSVVISSGSIIIASCQFRCFGKGPG